MSGESINITVNPGDQEVIPIKELEIGVYVTGSFTVSGGGNEIKFWVIDPDGNTILHLGNVIQGDSFEFSAPKNGVYSVRLDNRESTAAKIVNITYDIQVEDSSSTIYFWGKILSIPIIALLFLYYLRVRGHQKGEKT